jgi:hypothetical protein
VDSVRRQPIRDTRPHDAVLSTFTGLLTGTDVRKVTVRLERANAKAEDEAASRWSDCDIAYGDQVAQPQALSCAGRRLWRDEGVCGQIDVVMP